jgi:uncharacterized protein YcbK (DUF882 family)
VGTHRESHDVLQRVRDELASAPSVAVRARDLGRRPRRGRGRWALRIGLVAAAGVGIVAIVAFTRGGLTEGLLGPGPAHASAVVVAAPPVGDPQPLTVVEPLPPETTAPAAIPGGEGSLDPLVRPEHFTIEVVNTRRTVNVVLAGPAGEPDEESYRALRHELRSPGTGAESPIDPRLIELLHEIARRTGGVIEVLSAFRAPKSLGESNYHTRGMAADIRVPYVSTLSLRDLAQSLGAHGVGYYPTSGFVHVDVRENPFFWMDTSGPGEGQDDKHASYADPQGAHPKELAVPDAGAPSATLPQASAERVE